MTSAETSQKINAEFIENLAFIGSTLGPLFLHDPKLQQEVVGTLYETFSEADAQSLAVDWPFTSPGSLEKAFEKMTSTAEEGVLQDSAEELNALDSTTPSPLVMEYRRLFIGPGKKAAAPWGSVYTDKDQVVFGESTLQLRDWLREHGISINSGESDEPEDHIGTLLVLLSWLAEEQPEALTEFLQMHLLPWAPHFLEEMQESAEHPFFEGLAEVTLESLKGVQHALNLEVEEPRFYR